MIDFLILIFALFIMPPFASRVFHYARSLSGYPPPAAQQPPNADDQPEVTRSGSVDEDGLYEPSPIDVAVVRIMMSRSKNLPPDLVDVIFDYAEYWAHSVTTSARARSSDGSSNTENLFVLRTPPVGLTSQHEGSLNLTGRAATPRVIGSPVPASTFAKIADYPTPRIVHPVRKLVFKISGHDQGMGGTGSGESPYVDSWTWYDVGLERLEARTDTDSEEAPEVLQFSLLRPIQPPVSTEPGYEQGAHWVSEDENQSGGLRYHHELLPSPEWMIQKNKGRTRNFQHHVVTWSWTDNTAADSDEGKSLEAIGRGRATGNGEFVRGLQMGDVITLWAKARFLGWSNNFKDVSVKVYWAM